MKNLKKWSVAVAVILAIVGVLVVYKVLDIQAGIAEFEQQPEYAESVEATTAGRIEFTPSTQVMGEVVAPQRVELRNELAGKIQAINFSSGDNVSAGEVLIQMDVSEELARLNSAKARVELAKTTNKRIGSLRHTNAVSEERYDQTLAELRIAEAEAALLKAIIEKKTLRAPFDAVAGIHQFEAGQHLEENTLITTLIGLQDYVWVDFSLSQFYKPLSVGSEVSIVIVSGSQESVEESAVAAKIIARDTSISSDARSRKYRTRVETSGLTLVPNTVVAVNVPIGQSVQKVVIPTVAILHSAVGPYVYRLVPDEQAGGYRAKQQPVNLGAQLENQTIVETGLSEGDLVAAQGAFKLSEGLLAYIAERAATVSSVTEPATEAQP